MSKIKRYHSSEQISKAKRKLVSIEKLAKHKFEVLILTKGVFDILHYGHLSLFAYLNELKLQNGSSLIVAIASDRVVKLKKGEKRPINSELDRVMQIALLPQVDFVLVHDELNYIGLIEALKPDIYVKGMDTVGPGTDFKALVDGNPELVTLGESSQIIIFEDDSSVSSSSIINRIKEFELP